MQRALRPPLAFPRVLVLIIIMLCSLSSLNQIFSFSEAGPVDSSSYVIDLPYHHEARAESSSKLFSISRVDSHHPDGKEFALADLAVHFAL